MHANVEFIYFCLYYVYLYVFLNVESNSDNHNIYDDKTF